MPKREPRTIHLSVRLEQELGARLDRLCTTLAPPLRLSRSQAVRALLEEAVARHERSLPPSRPQPADGCEAPL